MVVITTVYRQYLYYYIFTSIASEMKTSSTVQKIEGETRR